MPVRALGGLRLNNWFVELNSNEWSVSMPVRALGGLRPFLKDTDIMLITHKRVSMPVRALGGLRP